MESQNNLSVNNPRAGDVSSLPMDIVSQLPDKPESITRKPFLLILIGVLIFAVLAGVGVYMYLVKDTIFKETFSSGFFSNGLKNWDVNHNSNVQDEWRVELVKVYDREALYIQRIESSGDGGRVSISQDINLDVSKAESLFIKMDLNIIDYTLEGSGWWSDTRNSTGEYPVQLWIKYIDGEGMPKSYSWGFLDKENSNLQTNYDLVGDSGWHTYISQDLKLFDIKEITSISIGGSGWDFHSMVDNFEIITKKPDTENIENKLTLSRSPVGECLDDSFLRLYEDKNYEGRCIALSDSVNNLVNFNFDNIVSSLRVKDGYSATFFEEVNYQGGFRPVWTSVPSSSSGFDNLTSSIKVRDTDGYTIEISLPDTSESLFDTPKTIISPDHGPMATIVKIAGDFDKGVNTIILSDAYKKEVWRSSIISQDGKLIIFNVCPGNFDVECLDWEKRLSPEFYITIERYSDLVRTEPLKFKLEPGFSFLILRSPSRSGGDQLCLGEDYPIKWEHRGASRISIYVSQTPGDYQLVGVAPANFDETGVKGNGTFVWKVGVTVAGEMLQESFANMLRIRDESGYLIDETDSPFYIIDCRG